MSDTITPTVSMKLLIDTHNHRVLFAEAGKDFVDFLFYLFCLPLGSLINAIREQKNMGSMTNLYQSLENLNDSYMQPNRTKEAVLKPEPAPSVSGFNVPLLGINDVFQTQRSFYRCICRQYGSYITDNYGAVCPCCGQKMTTRVTYVGPNEEAGVCGNTSEGGFVKGVVTYMVMDDLVVKPLSSISSIVLLNKLNIKEVGSLEEKVVTFGLREAVKLFNASLHSKNVLTDVFLKATK